MYTFKYILKYISLVSALLFSVLDTVDSNAQTTELYEPFSERFTSPLGLEYTEGEPDNIYLLERTGLIKRLNIKNRDEDSFIWLDISDRIVTGGERGLLGMAFHPNYPENQTFYLNYTSNDENGSLITRISRFQAVDGLADPASEEILITFAQAQDNHNGGQLAFGPDGYLYIALGDGGRDNRLQAQNTLNYFGSILRIDVNTNVGYEIPQDNPFVGNPDGLDEIYAWGFRNPWRISFDQATGKLWVADVGQQERESIYIVEKGKNYGWSVIEGSVCYIFSTCNKEGLEMPLYEYQWGGDETGYSVTGGYVYRGKDNPSLYGKYLYGDFISGRIWAMEVDHETGEVISNEEIYFTDFRIPSFGIDSNGEVYILRWQGDFSRIYRFTPELTLTTAALKSVDGGGGALQLSWEVNRETGIEEFEIYKGASLDDMSLLTTVAGSQHDFIDSDPFDGATFYKVRAIETDGIIGEMSDPVSYYKSTESISENWSMLSIPFFTEGVILDNSIVYSFDGSYSVADQLTPGNGYWVRSTVSGGTEFNAEGTGLQSVTLRLNAGWNLIGGLSGGLPNEFLIDDGGILTTAPIFGFNGSSYQEVSSISSGQGYWLYAEQSGEVTLDLGSYSATLPLNTVSNQVSGKSSDVIQPFDRLTFETTNGIAELFISDVAISGIDKNRYRLPPIAPNAALDVRTPNGFKVIEDSRFEPVVITEDFPLIVRFMSSGNGDQMMNAGAISVYEVKIKYEADGRSESATMKEGESFTIHEPFSRLEFLRTDREGELVTETQLLPSYPNPFNPVTTLSYRLSDRQEVSLTIFDAAGRQIATLVDSEQESGLYTLPFDASGLASGIYFVRFSAGDVLDTQKLTLIK